jgi:hypothetical protein
LDRNNNIITHPNDIAKEIYAQQSITNKPIVPTYYYQHDHDSVCTCGVRQYPWHDIIGYTIEKRGHPLISLYTYFDQETYDLCLKNIATGKTLGPNKISNSILKNMPS